MPLGTNATRSEWLEREHRNLTRDEIVPKNDVVIGIVPNNAGG